MIWPRECFTTEMKSVRHRGAEKKGEKERESLEEGAGGQSRALHLPVSQRGRGPGEQLN